MTVSAAPFGRRPAGVRIEDEEEGGTKAGASPRQPKASQASGGPFPFPAVLILFGLGAGFLPKLQSLMFLLSSPQAGGAPVFFFSLSVQGREFVPTAPDAGKPTLITFFCICRLTYPYRSSPPTQSHAVSSFRSVRHPSTARAKSHCLSFSGRCIWAQQGPFP